MTAPVSGLPNYFGVNLIQWVVTYSPFNSLKYSEPGKVELEFSVEFFKKCFLNSL